jgi:hypothetical protein
MKFINVPWYFLWKFKRETLVASGAPFSFPIQCFNFILRGPLCPPWKMELSTSGSKPCLSTCQCVITGNEPQIV